MNKSLFTLSTLIQVAGCAFASFWPLHILKLRTTTAALKSYTLANSNLDICVLVFLNVTLLLVYIWIAAKAKPRRGSSFRDGRDRHKVAATSISITATIFQLLLLSKAVLVAILGSDDVFPTHKHHHYGLAYIYGAIILALLTSFIQAPTSRALVFKWQRQAARIARSRAANSLLGGSADASSTITSPLLGSISNGGDKNESNKTDIFDTEEQHQEEETRKATIGALLKLSLPDAPILIAAFSAGAVAALGLALIPYYTGKIIDYASIDPDRAAFKLTTFKLLLVALVCALFTGLRGGLFTVSMTRLNVRLRRALFESLLAQDAGFFDSTKTGEITSRLAADTSTVSDQISLNLNVMLRSATQGAMVLAFMFSASWRLTVVTFVMVPVVLAICKVYGAYYRKMSKKVQSELAEGNSVAEEALSTMTTVKAHAAEGSTKAAYAEKLNRFYLLQKSEAAAYAAYMMTNTFLSAAVVAGVLFYGGNLVLAHHMSAGALVSFMLYQQSLSGAFQSLGDVFSALSAAVGAADKVIELMHRRPAIPPPGSLIPDSFTGHIELRDVTFTYPSRPQLVVLSNFALSINPGEVVALVGPSGGGKSSIVKLLERFYLPTSGSVLIDGIDVGMFDPGWLRR